MDVQDRHVVVTGAGSGIGAALARAFAGAGARAVVVADLNADNARQVAEGIGGLAVEFDAGREEGVRSLVQRARDANGPIDVFFSNAGVPGPGGGAEASDEDWDLIWRVNVMAHVWAARHVVPEMAERGEGYLLSTASAAGLLTQVGALAYSVTKAAAVAAAEWLAIAHRDQGVRVSCLCPQGVRTPMLDTAMEDQAGGGALAAEGLLEPEQVAEAVLEAMREERFLILPHPQVARYTQFKAADPDRWLEGMRRMVREITT